MSSNDMVLFRRCVDFRQSEAWAITDTMQDERCKSISLRTFSKYVDLSGWARVQRDLSYSVGAERGLHIKDDFHVAYFRAVFCGVPCVVMVHSAIEFFFIKPENFSDAANAIERGQLADA